jgi:hypothetical protein
VCGSEQIPPGDRTLSFVELKQGQQQSPENRRQARLRSDAFDKICEDWRAAVFHPQERQAHLNLAIAYRPKYHTSPYENLNRGWKNRNAESGSDQAESCLRCSDFLDFLWLKARVGAFRHDSVVQSLCRGIRWQDKDLLREFRKGNRVLSGKRMVFRQGDDEGFPFEFTVSEACIGQCVDQANVDFSTPQCEFLGCAA